MKQFLLSFFMMVSINVSATDIVTDTIFDRAAHEEDFAFGADISWLSQQESWGTVYRNRKGQQKNLMDILKDEEGINALRFRVWTGSSGYSTKQDVINLCKRAHAKGYKIMIDFHYSDTWADPGSQTIPSQWTDHSVSALAQKVYDHTYDILSSLKALGITPRWVQIGNETKRGMLWDVGKTSSTAGYDNFATFLKRGIEAVKAVDENIKTIVHLPDGHDNSLYRNMFDQLKKRNVPYDIIGMSAYPRWSHLDITTDAAIRATINKYMTNVRDMKSRYGKEVMIVETGHYNDQPIDANHFLVEFMKALIDGGALGCFYWEPEAMSGYNLGAWDPDTHQASLAMDAFLGLKRSEVDHLMEVRLEKPANLSMFDDGNVETEVSATHARNRISDITWFIDRKADSTLTAAPYTYTLPQLSPGIHTIWATATDTDGLTQQSPTATFLVGPALYLGDETLVVDSGRQAHIEWDITFPADGNYILATNYMASTIRTGKLFIDSLNFSVIFNEAKSDTLRQRELKDITAGTHHVRLNASLSKGLPESFRLYLLPADGISTPSIADPAGIDEISTHNEERNTHNSSVVYDLGGRRLTTVRLGQIVILDGKKHLVKEQ